MASLNYTNRNVIFQSGSIKISSELNPEWNEIIERRFTNSIADGGFDWTTVGGNPLLQYPSGVSGESLQEIHIAQEDWDFVFGGVRAYGGNLGYGPDSEYYGSFFAVDETGEYIAGLDLIQINSQRKNGNNRSEGNILGTIVHELLHESSNVTNAVEDMITDIQSKSTGLSSDQLNNLRPLAEHVIIQKMMVEFARANGLDTTGGYIDATSSNKYEKWLTDKIAEFDAGVDATEMAAILESASRAPGLVIPNSISSVIYNEDGSVSAYVNEQGDKVEVAKGYYTENMLNLYGKETVDSEGNITASMTLGGTLRALADWLGFDGEFGIQGGFANESEGSDKEPVDAAKPVVLDMDGDGIEVSLDYQASFDYDGDGFKERTAWVSADDAFLVVDLNADGSFGAGDGKIDQRKELVLSDWHDAEEGTDLQALAQAEDEFGDKLFDTNGDGKLTAADTSFSNFRVWQDLDQDGEVDAGEMRTLAEAGITQINLTYDNGLGYDDTSDDLVAGGASQAGSASFVMDGITHIGGVGDMVLAHDTRGWKRVELTDAGGNVIGYSIELEGGANLNYGLAIEDVDGNFDLTALDLDGATGDARNNVLDAGGHTKAVTITGGEGNDVITGGWAGDMISGDIGADELRGGSGNDEVFFDAADTVVEGGDGDDTAISVEKNVYGANGTLTSAASDVTLNLETSGFESAYGGDGNDVLSTSAGFATSVALNGGEGDDTLTSGAGNDTLSGDAGDDVLTANAGDDTVIGGGGNDTIHGGEGNDFLLGDVGNDIINGDGGSDFIVGGTGDDIISGGDGDDNLDGGAGSDTISGGDGDDYINSGGGYDVITTGEGDDYVDAGTGNDTMSDTTGDDFFIGGAGDDTLNMSTADGVDIFQGGVGNDTVKLVGNAAEYTWVYKESGAEGKGQYVVTKPGQYRFYLIVQDVEHLKFDDQIVDLSNTNVDEDNSADFLEDTTKDGDVNGSSGNDTFDPGVGDDSASGNGGDDIIEGGNGDDHLDGGTGNDTLNGDSGNDEVFGGLGVDSITGGSGADSLIGGDDADVIYGGEGNDTIIGDGGNSIAEGKDGTSGVPANAETNVANGGGNDILSGGAGEDTILGGKGDDTIHGDDGADFVNAGIGDDTVYGDSGADQLYGGDGADTIYGGHGDDYIVADSGYSLDVTVHLARFLAKGSESKSVTEARVTEVEAGLYSVVDVINSYLGVALGNTADGSEYAGSVLDKIAEDELSFTDSAFLTAVLPRIYGRAATTAETSFWQVKLDNGAAYAAIVLEAIEQAIVDTAKVQSAMVLFGEYTTAEATALSFDDTVYGDEGNDEIYAGKGDDTVEGGLGHDKLHGGAGDDTLTGGAGSDSLLGGLGTDTLTGGEGADVLEGGHGADVIHGDNAANNGETNPFDTLSYEGSDEGVNIDLLNSTASGGDAEGDTFDGIEWVAGSEYDDDLTGDAGDNRLFSNGGSDELTGGAGNDHLYGGTGNDRLDGEAGDDRLYGDDGADVVNGGAGDDLVVGGDGDDILSGGDGEDLLVGGDGADVFMLKDDGQDTVEDFTVGADTIGIPAGLSFTDLVLAGAGDYFASTDTYADTVVTFANTALHGNASLYLSGVNITDPSGLKLTELDATSVTSVEVGTSGADVLDLSAAVHRVNIDGDAGADTLTGSALNDTLSGGSGNDSLQGGDGDDTYVINLNSAVEDSGLVETDLTEMYRGSFSTYKIKQSDGSTTPLTERTIDGDFDHHETIRKSDYLEIRLGADFDLTRIVLDIQSNEAHRMMGATISILDANYVVLDNFVITNTTSFDYTLNQSSGSAFVQVLPAGSDDLKIQEIQIFGPHDVEDFERDTIIDGSGSNTIRIDGTIHIDDITGVNSGDDLVLSFGDSKKSVTITDQWLDLDAPAVAFMELSNGEIVDMRIFHDLGGDDTLTGTTGADTLNGYIGNDEIDGGAGNDTLNGGEGNDRLLGGDGYDIINGGDGDDYIADGSGTGIFDGGDGIDTIDISHSSSGATVNLGAGTTVWSGGATETITNFENVVGSNGANTITGTDEINVIDGQDGNDIITGGLGRDTLMGGAGDDTYIYNLGDGSDVIAEGVFLEDQLDIGWGEDGQTINYGDDNSVPYGYGDGETDPNLDAGTDKILFGAGITQADLTFTDIGDDLLIHLPDGATITIQNFVNQKVETLEFADGSTMDMTNRGDVTWTGKTTGTFSNGRDNYFSGEGDDILNARGGHDKVQGGGGNDAIVGAGGLDNFYGGAGNDSISGGIHDDIIYGDSGDDIISGDADVDYLDGGTGNDTADFSYWTTEEAGQGAGTVLAGVEIDLEAELATWSPTITETIANFENAIGSGGNDTIIGTVEANVIDGGAGDDVIEAGAGDDTISGGTGSNTYVFSRGDGMDTITDFNADTDTLRIEGAAIANILIENVTYNGSGVLVTYGWDADGNPVDQVFLDGVPASAFGYGDIITLENDADGSNSADTFVGTDAHENIIMNDGADTITAGGGNDDIDAGAGADTVYAGTGNDKVTGGTGADLIYLDAGNDIFVDDAEIGATGNDVVYGGDGDDLFLGEGGNDTFYGGAGNDTLNGGSGNDTLVGDAGATDGKLIATYYRMSNTVNSVNDIPVLTNPDGISIVDDLNVDALAQELGGRADYYGIRYVGTINVVTAGDYTFETGSDDGSQLWIDGVLIVDNDGLQGLTYQSDVLPNLTAGQHKIEIRYFEKTGGNTLEATIQGPDTGAVELDLFASGMLGDAAAHSEAPSDLGLEDILNGGAGDDILTGGSGADIIELDFGSGSDTMTDFQEGLDIIDLSATGLTFADLTIADNASGDAVISFDDGNAGTPLDELTLTGIAATDLTAADFQFG